MTEFARATWTPASGPGLDYCLLDVTDRAMEGFSARYGDDGLIALFVLRCNGPWATTRVDVTRLRPRPEAQLRLDSDGSGHWWLDGRDAPELQGCIDVDLGCTPATNTLPIRRLELPVGGEAEILAAWVRFPDLDVQPLRQRYRRLAEDRYEYSSDTFQAELTVDEHGLVIDYAGAWMRERDGPNPGPTSSQAG